MRASIPPEAGGQERHELFLKERINLTEKHFSNLCSAFGGYTTKIAALRDKSDEVAITAHNFAETENVSNSLRSGLEDLASTLITIGDYRDAEVHRLESRLVAELSQYEGLCKGARELLKSTLAARDAEAARKKYFTRLRESNPRLTQQIAHAESEASKASVEVARASMNLREQTDKFERKKLHDIRKVLLDFVTIELSFNAKAVELYTKAYNDVLGINEAEDLRDFRRALNLTEAESSSRLGSLVKDESINNNSRLISNLFSTSSLFKRPEFLPKLNQPLRKLQDNRDNSTIKTGPGSTNRERNEVEEDSSFNRCEMSRGKSSSEIATPPLTIGDDFPNKRLIHSRSVGRHQLFATQKNSKASSSIQTIACRSTSDDKKHEFSFDYCVRPASVGLRQNEARLRYNIAKSLPKFGSENSTTCSGDDAEDEPSSLMAEGGR